MTNENNFVHLHCHDQFSLLDGFGTADAYVKRAIEIGQSAIALTNHGNVDGLIKFQKSCLKADIEPILGCELYIVPDLKKKEGKERRFHMTVLIQNEAGFQNLLRMLSIANLEGHHYRPRMDPVTVLAHREGLVFMSACLQTFINMDGGLDLLLELKKTNPVALEVMPHNIQGQAELNIAKHRIAYQYQIPLVATNDCFVKDTKITTIDGIKSIQDVKIGDFVLTHEGRYKKVLFSNKRELQPNEKLYKIKGSVGSEIGRVTSNHPYYTCKYSYDKKIPYDFDWKSVSDLTPNDYLVIPKIYKDCIFADSDFCRIDLLTIKKYQLVNRNTYFKHGIEYIRTVQSDRFGIDIPRYLKIDDDFLEILGWMIAQGSLDNQQHIGLSFHKSKKWKANKAKLFFENFGLKVSYKEKDNYIVIGCGSSVLSELFISLVGKGATNKHLPYIDGTFIKKWSEKQLSKIIKAYSSEDGHCSKKYNSFMVCASVSKQLTHEFGLLLNSIGIASSIQITNHKESNWNLLYSITLDGGRLHKFLNWTEEESEYNGKYKSKLIETGNYYLVKFQKREEIEYIDYVYNIEVEEDNSYVADGFIVHNCHYPLAHQHQTQEMLLAIQRKAKWSDPDRWRFGFTGLHLRSAEEMALAFREQGAMDEATVAYAMGQTMAFAELCRGFRIESRPVNLPKAHGYEDRDETELMWEIVTNGWKERLNFEDCYIGDDKITIYQQRVEEEMSLICKQGFQRYFLIVWELINWCHSKGIMTGPGRGSVGGSLVAYLMNITDVDPIKYGLIFARFISPERNDFPDIDMDFPKDRREEVRRHLDECYGKYNTGSITTFLTMKGSMALRDVARVFDITGEVDKPAKFIIDKPDGDPRAGHTIEDSLKAGRPLKPNNPGWTPGTGRDSSPLWDFKCKYPEAVALAIELEGQARGYGKHAAGVCISADDLRDGKRCYLAIREGVPTANWDKGDAEYMGLMKLDVLGLSTLSVLNYARELLKDQGIEIEFDKIPLDDQKVFTEMSQGHSVGIFQMGTHLLIKLAKEMGVREFNDIVLLNALSRPGPLGSGMTDDFIARKRGQRPVTHIHPRLEPYTRETCGIVIYQEQVMWAMYELAGLSWGVCDKVRKVMGKSKGSEAFEKFKQQFVDGCSRQQTLAPNEAAHVWDTFASFGAYGFNKAHAVEYSLIGYWTAWLKFNHTKEFMAALLTHGGEKDKPGYINEARRLGLAIALPRLGKSDAVLWKPGRGNVLLAPFTEIKGVGEAQAHKIVNGSDKPKAKAAAKGKAKKVHQGFFDQAVMNPEPKPVIQPRQGSAIDEILHKVGADGRAMTDAELKEAQQYFSFNIKDKANRFSGLMALDPRLKAVSELDLLACNINSSLIRIGKFLYKTDGCSDCELRQQAKAPVNPSIGRYNVMVVGEAPGADEDQQGIGFIGKAGTGVLWPELKKHGLSALMFHVSNVCKCWPGKQIKTPGKRHIQACSKHLETEITGLKPVVILAFGNTCNQFFRGESSGISELNGRTEWSDRFQCWICWCLHPAAVLHSGGNRGDFERGIANFAQVLTRLGGRNQGTGQVPQTGTCPWNGRFGVDNGNYLECEQCRAWGQCAVAASYGDWIK